MNNLFGSRKGHREGALDGLNLFFGALLGANLGTLEGLRLVSFVQLVTLLACTVMALRVFSTSENRPFAFMLLAFYCALVAALATIPELAPRGMAPDDLRKLVATLAVWVLFVLVLELVSSRVERRAAQKALADVQDGGAA
ncbi:MAG TPA: hypothetical protein VD887_02935 [Allosphingosinicella sp.]|nr:hypothetical protein [Allosphingosinicella sp.]